VKFPLSRRQRIQTVRVCYHQFAVGILSVCVACAVALVAVEAIARWLEHGRAIRAAAVAHKEGYHGNAWQDVLGDAGFLAPSFSGYVTNEYGQQVEWVHNSFGFRTRREISRHRPPGVLRLLMLGDSFVAGHRLGQEQTVGYQMEKWLQDQGFSGAEVLIAAIEEPTTGLDYLETFGVRFEPQVVLLGITLGNDLAQVYNSLAGEHSEYRFAKRSEIGSSRELERNPKVDRAAQIEFVKLLRMPKDSQKGPGPGPPSSKADPGSQMTGSNSLLGFHFLGLLRATWLTRRAQRAPQATISYWNEYREPYLFDGNGLDMCLSPAPAEIEQTYQLLFQVLSAYQRVCDWHGIRFMVMLHAQRYQVQPGDLEATIKAYSLNPARFDWMAPNRRIRGFCVKHGIPCFDPTEAMAAEYARTGEQMFMPRGDMHWNARGAKAFFEGVKPDLARELGSLPR
jgi:hypothetical protein